MLTLSRLKNDLIEIPMSIAWYLTEISKSRGTQDLFIRQTPQKLERLREHALIESAVSSNRIEGVEIDRKRVGTVLFGKKLLTDRNEEEVQGYRKALDVIDAKHGALNVTERNIQLLHSLCRGEIWDAGRYKEKDGNIIERLPNGETTIRFKTVPAKKTPFFMKKLLEMNDSLMKNERIPSLITIAAFNLDFLCIHPFRDGNGRVSRLLLSLQLHRAGFEVGRYISLERLIEENKERYYETLKVSSQKWHEGKHDPWPYVGFLLSLLRSAYIDFERRLGSVHGSKGDKTETVLNEIREFHKPFSLNELLSLCPDVSRDMVRKVLKDLRKNGSVISKGKGPGAVWERKGKISE